MPDELLDLMKEEAHNLKIQKQTFGLNFLEEEEDEVDHKEDFYLFFSQSKEE